MHPGAFIREKIPDSLRLTVSEVAKVLDARRAGLSDPINGNAAWTKTNAKGETVSHTREGTTVIDLTAKCRTTNGSSVTQVASREVLPEDLGPAEQSRIDQDRVAAGSEFDVECVHVHAAA